jgi:hypothetical protein
MALQDFFRMRNIFGGSPNQSVNSGASTPPFLPSRNTVPPSTYQESIDVFPEEETALSALKRNVMNPPEVPFEYPKSAAAGITEALKIAAEPSPLEKNRVYVDGKAYQKQQVITDAEGKKHYVTNVHEPSFMQQVMRAMPAAASAAPDILNAQAQRPIAEWEMRNKALTGAANIEKTEETNRALAAQRYANAGVIPQREQRLTDQGNVKLDQAQQKINQNQQKIDHLMSRQDLTESEKAALADRYKKEQMSLKADYDKQLQEMRGGQRIEQIGAKGDVDKDIQELRGSQRMEQIGAGGEEARKTAGVRGSEARETKAVTPGGAGATSQLPTQQKVAQQMKATQATREHPEWKKYISTDPNTGMVEIMPPATGYFSRGPDQETYDAMVQYMGGGATSTGASTKPTATTPTKSATSGAPKPPPAKGSPVPKGYVKIADSTGKVITTIPEADVARLNKSKYHVVQ